MILISLITVPLFTEPFYGTLYLNKSVIYECRHRGVRINRLKIREFTSMTHSMLVPLRTYDAIITLQNMVKQICFHSIK